ncbi:MAG: glycosyltransferase family 2 protein [Nitrospirae bacterium]|nr:glycosyltransferase family 2 protein [Nitrospirota bacterium]
MKVSVIIPTYNRGHILERAIESVMAQTYANWELIIVDDGSTDNTEELTRTYLSESRVYFFRQENTGVAAARNTGIAHATGDLIAFLDSDDAWEKEKLATEVDIYEKHPEVGMAFSDVQTVKDGAITHSYMPCMPLFSSMVDKSLDVNIFPSRAIFAMLLQEYPTIPSATTVRKKLIDQNGMFKLMNAEDWEFALRISRYADIAYINKPLATRFIQGDSVNSTKKPYALRDMILELSNYRKPKVCDSSERAAARNGQETLYRFLGWYYLHNKMRRKAISTYIKGFLDLRSGEMLFRSFGVLIPAPIYNLIKNLFCSQAVQCKSDLVPK